MAQQVNNNRKYGWLVDEWMVYWMYEMFLLRPRTTIWNGIEEDLHQGF